MRFSALVDALGTAMVAIVMAMVRHWRLISSLITCAVLFVGGYLMRRQADQLLSFAVVVLPTVFALSIEVVSKSVRENPYYRVAVVIFGLTLSALRRL